jgi:hypothetical protein
VKRRELIIFVLAVAFSFSAQPAYATIVLNASGISAKGVPVRFEAKLTIDGDGLTVQLINNSPVPTLNPDDTLSSFYFDIVNASHNHPLLTYSSAYGDVYLASKKNPDALQTANANIMAVKAGDDSWAFKTMDETQNPFLGFGIGTVGNSNLTPNNFQGTIVGNSDYSIYAGDITTQNLNGKLLVKNSATFTFGGLTGFTEEDIAQKYAFGLGTAPNSLLTVQTGSVLIPEPASVLLLSMGFIGIFRRSNRQSRKK